MGFELTNTAQRNDALGLSKALWEEFRKYDVRKFPFFCLYIYVFFHLLTKWVKEYWPNIKNFDKQNMVFATLTVSHMVIVLVVNLTFVALYKAKIPFFEKYKTQPGPWPWEVNPERFREVLKNCLFKVVLPWHLIYFPALAILSVYIMNDFTARLDAESIPDWWEIFKHILFGTLVEDIGYYLTHRLFHLPWFYKRFHKVHHENNMPSVIATEYAHPVDNFISGLIPAALPLMILGSRMHIWEHIMWSIVKISKAVEVHSGYDFPWHPYRLIPFGVPASFHDSHHSRNMGNYGSAFNFWDIIFNTDDEYARQIVSEEDASHKKRN